MWIRPSSTPEVSSCSAFCRSHEFIPPHGGIKRPHVKFCSFFDTCGYNQLSLSNPPMSAPARRSCFSNAGGSCPLAPNRFLSNDASLSRSLRFVPHSVILLYLVSIESLRSLFRFGVIATRREQRRLSQFLQPLQTASRHKPATTT
jgi:hypothetical protein